MQVLKQVNIAVHMWTKNLTDGFNTQLPNTVTVKMPVKRGMSIADAERGFHTYVSPADLSDRTIVIIFCTGTVINSCVNWHCHAKV